VVASERELGEAGHVPDSDRAHAPDVERDEDVDEALRGDTVVDEDVDGFARVDATRVAHVIDRRREILEVRDLDWSTRHGLDSDQLGGDA
jgi:hypothetical protein